MIVRAFCAPRYSEAAPSAGVGYVLLTPVFLYPDKFQKPTLNSKGKFVAAEPISNWFSTSFHN